MGERHDVENDDVDEGNEHEDREDGLKAGLLEDDPEGREDDEGDRKKKDREYEQMPGLKQVSHGGLPIGEFPTGHGITGKDSSNLIPWILLLDQLDQPRKTAQNQSIGGRPYGM